MESLRQFQLYGVDHKPPLPCEISTENSSPHSNGYQQPHKSSALFLRYLIAAHTELEEGNGYGCPGDGQSRNRDIKSMFATTAVGSWAS
ncbi:hypothetical protein CDAR_457191 [Caerostris darwini]|uniref:Uncharacterized protein n=1 Tax=Caerostris darwini TaxID=1538125 RepID=A0AAV4PAY6_9ARAC|nr:hypothetical protein CDAR_457191 [Caerostris darwini]